MNVFLYQATLAFRYERSFYGRFPRRSVAVLALFTTKYCTLNHLSLRISVRKPPTAAAAAAASAAAPSASSTGALPKGTSRSNNDGGLGGASAMAGGGGKTVFEQMVARMPSLGPEALLLPHRVWKVKFVGEERQH